MSTPASIQIRSATAADIDTILEFIRALAAYEQRLDEVTATSELLQQSLFGDQPLAECLLAEEGSQAIGFALFYQNFSTFLSKPGMHLEDLFVLPEKRGRGYGRQLLAHLAQLAVERDYGRFDWTVLDWNRSAIDFYQQLGATLLEDWQIFRLEGDSLSRLAQDSTESAT